MACGTPDLFPPFFQSFTDCCLLVIFESQPPQIDLNNFEQYVVGSHTKIYKQVNCSTHIIFFDSLIHSKVTKIFTSTSFRSQQIDCLFTAFKFYFTEIVDMKGSIFQKLLAAVHFHQSLPYPSLKQPSLARKRLFRKRFKFHFAKAISSRSIPGPRFNADLISKVEQIVYSPVGLEFVKLVDSLSSGQKVTLDHLQTILSLN